MKTQFLSKTTLVLFVLTFMSATAFSFNQGRGNNSVNQRNYNMVCLNQLPGLTDDQVTEITSLNEEHQKEILDLRTERRSTIDLAEKSAIRTKMDELVKNHRDEVRALLTDEQKEVYDKLYLNNANGNRRYANNERGNCRGNSRVGRACYGSRGNGSATRGNGRRGSRGNGRW
ncbi:MAG: hypothetical protein K9G70_01730 [Prolixibacteraceae bacterium]|nr:hypothetical protein [Prolixibacteraceae bacterium]